MIGINDVKDPSIKLLEEFAKSPNDHVIVIKKGKKKRTSLPGPSTSSNQAFADNRVNIVPNVC